MSKFMIEQPFWDLFPQGEIGIIVAKGIDNTEESAESIRPEIIEFLETSNKEAKRFLTAAALSENKVVSVWREAYRKFRTKKGARSSIEALLKRVDKGNPVSCINPLVDIYNAVSLQFGIPCGGEDLDTFRGDLRLTMTQGGDEFLALGDEECDNTLPGEICYLDNVGAVCRCWNWRDGQRTMLTEDTKNAFLIIESVDPERSADVKEALEMLEAWTQKALGGTTKMEILNTGNREAEL